MKHWFQTLSFLGFYFFEVVKSNFRVAYDVLTPKHQMNPGVIRVRVDGMTDRQILFMANLITMTPGTLGLEISEDRRYFYLHAMYLDGPAEDLEEELSSTYGKRVRDVF